MRTQPETQQQLELAVEIANACHPESLVPADTALGQLRATIAVVLALRDLTAEIRETRAQVAKIRHVPAPQPVQLQPVQLPVYSANTETTREVRGQSSFTIMVLAGVIAALLLVIVVLALT